MLMVFVITVPLSLVYKLHNMSISLDEDCVKDYTGNDTYKCTVPQVYALYRLQGFPQST